MNIWFETAAEQDSALDIARRYQLTLDKTKPCLWVMPNKLVLKTGDFSPLSVDFSRKAIKKRYLAGKKQGLVRACKPRRGMHIVDATGGWGRDAAILASFGASVLMLEREPVMAALLEDALARRSVYDVLAGDLSLCFADAKIYLRTLQPDAYPDVIYIDPMHPLRQKSALVKKDMQVLQELVGTASDVEELLALSVARVKSRVVVKWPNGGQAHWVADDSIVGTTVRFDIFAAA